MGGGGFQGNTVLYFWVSPPSALRETYKLYPDWRTRRMPTVSRFGKSSKTAACQNVSSIKPLPWKKLIRVRKYIRYKTCSWCLLLRASSASLPLLSLLTNEQLQFAFCEKDFMLGLTACRSENSVKRTRW